MCTATTGLSRNCTPPRRAMRCVFQRVWSLGRSSWALNFFTLISSRFYSPPPTPQACLEQLGPSPDGFVLNLYYDENGEQVCSCCRECEGTRIVSR